jgi:hypothetical protein
MLVRGSVTPGIDGIKGGKEMPSGFGIASATEANEAKESLVYIAGKDQASSEGV